MDTYYTITVRGKQHEWVFPILIDPKYIKEWRDDGLIIDEVVATQPETSWLINYWRYILHELGI
jgi:hypothetical protein